ncbi:hypothetical protein JTB14_009270 [Gonioctena quinquepunctata]|nr:hypothetical protein JTB14_009270 [Gonioctena quinquepunctata]
MQSWKTIVTKCKQCSEVNLELISLRSEFEAVSKLAFHLEKRTQEQDELISLLKQSKKYDSNSIIIPSTTDDPELNESTATNPSIEADKQGTKHDTYAGVPKTAMTKTDEKTPKETGISLNDKNRIPSTKTMVRTHSGL